MIQEQAREVSLLLKGRTLTATLTEDIFANLWFLLCTEKEKRKNYAFLVEKFINFENTPVKCKVLVILSS